LDRIQQYSASLRAGSKTLPQLLHPVEMPTRDCHDHIWKQLPSIPKNAIMVSFAVAFIDQSDERKPIVPVISDQKLPVEKPSYFLILTSAFPFAALK
jgi:hypothetical protein